MIDRPATLLRVVALRGPVAPAAPALARIAVPVALTAAGTTTPGPLVFGLP